MIKLKKLLQMIDGKWTRVKDFKLLKEDNLDGLVIQTDNGFSYKLIKIK